MKKQVLMGLMLCGIASAWAGVRTNDYSWVRGVCYNLVHDDATAERELGYGRRVGLNAVRVWLWMAEWRADKKGFPQRVRESIRRTWKNGYYTMPIIFNGCHGREDPYAKGAWPEQLEYLQAIVNACKNEPGLLMWDVMNEPTCVNRFIDEVKSDPAKLEERLNILDAYLVRANRAIKACDPRSYTTIGYTTSFEIDKLPRSVKEIDVISFHDYSPIRNMVADNFDHAAEYGRKLGKPVIQSETGCLARANPYDVAIAACQKRQMGYFLFELMIHGRCDDEHGIFYPDGTVRDPATIAAIMGCYRNRNLDTIVVGSANREDHAKQALKWLREKLGVVSHDGFARPHASTRELLDACEKVANLLESCDLVPMAVPPTARIKKWRKMEKPPVREIREFAFEIAEQLRKGAQIP